MIDNEKERGRFNNLMNTFALVYGQPTTKEKNRVYFDLLQESPLEVLEVAAKRLLDKKTISTFPTIAEWKECCWQPAEDVLEIALKAWYELDGFLIAVRVPTDKKALDVICRLFGSWDNFRRSDKVREYWEKQDFVEMFMKVYRDHEKAQLAEGRVKGQLEAVKKTRKLKETRK